MKLMKTISLLLFAVALCFAQTTTTSTTLSAAITSKTANTVSLGSGTGVAAGSFLYVDREVMYVISTSSPYSTTRPQVNRGYSSTDAATHLTSSVVWVATAGLAAQAVFRGYTPSGSCTATNEAYLPVFNTISGQQFSCIGSKWVQIGGANPQVTFCGATTGNATCGNTASPLVRVLGGIATLASNSAVISGISPAFTSATTFSCVANDVTTRANVVQVVNTSTTSITITNTTGASDEIHWSCVGY